MFAHNSVVLRNCNHPENNFMLTGIEPTSIGTADKRSTTCAIRLSQKNTTLNDHKEDQAVLIRRG